MSDPYKEVLELIETCVASVSVLSCLALLFICYRLPRKRLLARQVMNLAIADLCFSLWAICFPVRAVYSDQDCDHQFKGATLLIFTLLVAQSHIAAANLAMGLRWQGCIRRMNVDSTLVITWAFGLILAVPTWFDQVKLEVSIGQCVQTDFVRIWTLVVGWSVLAFNSISYVLVIRASCRNSPLSVTAAYMRYSFGYLTGYLVCFCPELVLLLETEVALRGNNLSALPSGTFYHIVIICLNSNGVINMLIFILHWRWSRCIRLATLDSSGGAEGGERPAAHEPRLAHFSVAYVHEPEVIRYAPSSLHSASTGSSHNVERLSESHSASNQAPQASSTEGLTDSSDDSVPVIARSFSLNRS